MIDQGVKFILFDIIALWLVSPWSTKAKKNYNKKLYVVCSLICITMIRQGVFLLLLNIFALWPVSWWSTEGKCQDGAIWRMLLGLYHNDQPKDKFSSLKYKCSLARITMISQGKISRWRYIENAPWFVSQWWTKGKFSSPQHECSLTRITMISQGVFCCF